MLSRALVAIASVCSIFTLWAIAVSADDARQASSTSEPVHTTDANAD
jgi:hypothetical protein